MDAVLVTGIVGIVMLGGLSVRAITQAKLHISRANMALINQEQEARSLRQKLERLTPKRGRNGRFTPKK